VSRTAIRNEMRACFTSPPGLARSLTNYLKSPDFIVGKFPTSTFMSTGIEPAIDAWAKDATHTVTRNLTLHGVTKPISFPAKNAVSSDSATLESDFFVNHKGFGITLQGSPTT
jgi:polyisoprenoid-binding protein YceI